MTLLCPSRVIFGEHDTVTHYIPRSCCDAGVQAAVLAQVIPALGAALRAVLIAEARELRATARADAEPGHARIGLWIQAGLSLLAMAALTVSEVLCLLAPTGDELHGTAEVFVWVSVIFAMVMTFLLPPATLFWRLYQQPRRVPAPRVDRTTPPV